MTEIAKIYAEHRADADKAFRLFASYWTAGNKPARVPGMDTPIRMAWRLAHGKTIEEAAAREYVYRWHLAIKPFDQIDGATGYVGTGPACSIFGAPHTIGM